MKTKCLFATILLTACSLWSCTGTTSSNTSRASANAPTIDNTAARTSTTLPPSDSATA
ncbi:hypothetical protein [Pontibacter mangrovi]|uniref:hypothetical protein n=1 Tax=Pontibacter mangrovi TaxID=2589816 RepID=UPI0015E3B1BD|nr:hypothetical protein [Pontibacter mangrovi]